MEKQAIVIRKDLKMRRGKEIAQGSHASMAWMLHKIQNKEELSEEENNWINGSFKKVCLQVSSEEELELLYNSAKEKGLTVYMIEDSGLTEFGGVPTKTCLAIGPHKEDKINEVTSELKLY